MSETNNAIATPVINLDSEVANETSGAVDTVAEVAGGFDAPNDLPFIAPVLPDGTVLASTAPIALAAVLMDSTDEMTEGSVPAGQPIQELVTKTDLGGFGPSNAPKRDKPPVELHEYDSTYFAITARRAVTNNTIDFIFTRKADVAWPEDRTAMRDDETAIASWLIYDYAFDKYAEVVKELPSAPDFNKLPFSLVFNLKPVQKAESIVRVGDGEIEPKGDDAAIYAFILLSPNAPVSEDQLSVIPRSIRVNEHASTVMFYAVCTLIKEAYNRGEVGTAAPQATDGDLTMEKIRRHYLKLLDSQPQAAKPTQTKKEVKADKAAKVTGIPAPQATADVVTKDVVERNTEQRQPRERAERPERAEREQRENGTQGRASDRLLHRHIELSNQRHDDVMSQLRTNQRQQGQIIEGQQAILTSNETLFSIMNLVIKALGGK